jgi:putative acetyltransferase
MITVEHITSPTDDAHSLIAELDEELSRHYPPEQRHGLTLEGIFQPHIRFFIARAPGGVAAGCGGVALFEGFAEIKRMYVRPRFRGRGTGVASAIIARLESEAKANGRSLVRLETGVQQQAALRFYARHGYRECTSFAHYATMPAHSIATSIFMEKRV